MAQPYGPCSRSFFKIDLVVNERIAHSTPNRLYFQDGKRKFIKYVRSTEPNFDILVRYAHWFPNIEAQSYLHPPEQLIATIRWVSRDNISSGQQRVVIPYIQQPGDGDRKVIVACSPSIPAAHYPGTTTAVNTASLERTCIDATPPHSENKIMASAQLSDHVRKQFRRSLGDSAFRSNQYPIDIIVCLWKSNSALQRHSSDRLINGFRLICLDHCAYRAVLGRMLRDDNARRIFNEHEQAREEGRECTHVMPSRLSRLQRTESLTPPLQDLLWWSANNSY